MTLRFEKIMLPHESELLMAFLCGETWPFHSGQPTRESVNSAIATHAYDNPNVQTFWIRHADGQELGLIKLFDLEDIGDGAPLFDLRIKAAARGQGIGKAAVTWLTNHLFESWPQLQRIEGTTRQDNWAMRHVFATCGYLKEGHFRQAWQGYDAIQYAILRQDWESGRSSPVNWDDQPRPIQSQSHRDKIHPRWWPLLDGLNTQAQDYFGSGLKAVYLLGSLGRGQEIIGSSDLDLEWVIDHPPSETEKAWVEALATETLKAWPDLLKIDLDLLAQERLFAPESQRLRFIFASDGVRLWGEELLPEGENWFPGPKLAFLLNSHFRWARAEARRAFLSPTEQEQADPKHVAEYTHWICKQALRLGLGLAMCHQPVYTRAVADMPRLVAQILPDLTVPMELAYAHYRQPLQASQAALALLEQLAPLYALAEARWPEKPVG